MRRMRYGLAVLGALSLTALGAGCDSGGGSTPAPVADAGATDSGGQTTDEGGTGDTGSTDTGATDTGTGTTDTGTTTDAGTTDAGTTDTGTTDTGTTDTGGTPVERLCTDAELGAFNTCATACNNDTACQQGCLTSELSAACQGAYGALAQCASGAGCAGNDINCVQTNCPDKFAAVFGTGPEPTNCDPVTNDGCDAGQNCTFINQQLELGCVAAGTAKLDEECAATGCERGICNPPSPSEPAICYEFCDPMNNTCPDGRPCNIGFAAAAGQQPVAFVCGPVPVPCDLYGQDCPSGEACYPIEGGTSCYPTAGGAEGATCNSSPDCGPGLLCAGSPSKCLAICSLDGSTACATGTCTPLSGGGGFGVCVTQ